MKFKNIHGIALLAAACLAPSAFAQQPADSQGLSYQIFGPTNTPATVTSNSAATNLSIFKLHKGQGLGWSWTVNTGNATNVQNALQYIWFSVDGTNFPPALTTTANGDIGGAVTGTTNKTFVTNWSSTALAGYTAAMIGAATNSNNNGNLTNIANTINVPQ